MKGIKITLLCIAALMIFVGTASAQFPQHWAKETAIPLWVWTINWGGVMIPIQMVFPNIIASRELPPIGDYYGVVSGNRVRWYFENPIYKPISDILLCIKGKVFKEQFPQEDGYVVQTGRQPNSVGHDTQNGDINLSDQPRVAAWALPFDYQYAQPFVPLPIGGLPAAGSWNPYYLTARILPFWLGNVFLARNAPGIPGGSAVAAITLIDGFEICLLIRLPMMGVDTTADWDGDAAPPFGAIINNDPGNETEVALAAGDRLAVQIDIPSGHLHNIYLSPTQSVVAKYITPNPF